MDKLNIQVRTDTLFLDYLYLRNYKEGQKNDSYYH